MSIGSESDIQFGIHRGPLGRIGLMKIITVAQGKGGVGKTTIAVNIAGELSRRNYNVALVDSDPQGSACQWAEPGNLEFPVYEIGLENSGRSSIANWVQDVRRVDAEIVVIDTAPGARQLGASITIANVILVPCTASGLDIEATERTMGIIQAARRARAAPLDVILVPNRTDQRTLEGQQLEQELRSFGEMVAPPVSQRSAFVRAFSTGQSISDYAGGEAADLDISRLCDLVVHVIGRNR
jgi:chromosome partitioning protein